MGNEAQQRTTMRGLEAARGKIQSLLTSRVRLRETPVLRFILDESIQRTLEIEEKIRLARQEDECAAQERESRSQADLAGNQSEENGNPTQDQD